MADVADRVRLLRAIMEGARAQLRSATPKAESSGRPIQLTVRLTIDSAGRPKGDGDDSDGKPGSKRRSSSDRIADRQRERSGLGDIPGRDYYRQQAIMSGFASSLASQFNPFSRERLTASGLDQLGGAGVQALHVAGLARQSKDATVRMLGRVTSFGVEAMAFTAGVSQKLIPVIVGIVRQALPEALANELDKLAAVQQAKIDKFVSEAKAYIENYSKVLQIAKGRILLAGEDANLDPESLLAEAASRAHAEVLQDRFEKRIHREVTERATMAAASAVPDILDKALKATFRR